MSSQFLHKGIYTRWETDGLDWSFRSLWPEAKRERFVPFLDSDEATEGIPFPYCLLTVGEGQVLTRMSGNKNDPENLKRHTREYPVSFEIFAQPHSGDSRAAKQVAGDLCLKIMSVFGGHPDPATEGSPKEIPLDFGEVLQLSYESDFATKLDDDVHKWTIFYNALVDMPVAV